MPRRGMRERERRRPQSVSRILSTLAGCVVIFLMISLGKPCPAPKRGAQLLPGGLAAGRRPSPCLSCIAWGLPCPRRYLRGGGLLPHLFTLTLAGGLFSVALSVFPALPENPPLSRGTPPCDVRTFLYKPSACSDHPTTSVSSRSITHPRPQVKKKHRKGRCIWIDYLLFTIY